ncbi:MAG: PEP-CTERM sorting domain-containing protein [Candidatus Omnitrophica bacterium]|nr:PEP-CTERM sorting domain-containing protein [Candidatus Omnitrophota bacterium]
MSPKFKRTVFTAFILFLIASPAFSAVITFYPDPANMNNFTHQEYYTWGINWMPEAGEVIVSAQLFIDDINNWAVEANDQLTIHLLDQADLGVTIFNDNQGGGDNILGLPGNKILLDTYTDPADAPNTPGSNNFTNSEDYYYNFTESDISTLASYLDGGFGFGFDPDCHYWNRGVSFTVETGRYVIPEPTTLLLFGMGLLGFAFRRRS